LGVARYDFSIDDVGTINGNAFAYKAGLGVTYNFADNMAADLGYEYLGIADGFDDVESTDDIHGHNIVASFRYKF
jgi:opacity protein-like surface antigen